MKVSELIESLQTAVAEVPAYADAEVRFWDGNGWYVDIITDLATEDADSDYEAREDVLYLMSQMQARRGSDVREWYL